MYKLFTKFRDKLLAATFYEQTVVIYADREAVIENVKHLIGVNEICISMSTNSGYIALWGEGLSVNSYKGTTVKVIGKITSCDIQRRMIDE